MLRGKEVKVKKPINIEKIEKKEVTTKEVAEAVAEKEAAPEKKEIAEKVIATDTEEKAMEAERRTGEGVKAGATKDTLKAAVTNPLSNFKMGTKSPWKVI